MNAVSRTHIGRVRRSNQDALLVFPGPYGMYGVADGMGGHKAGDVASRMAAELLYRVLEGALPQEDLLRAAIEEVNTRIYEEQLQHEDLSGMGTTLTVLWETEDYLLLGHVGDSRAYLLRHGALKQISEDHSLVGEMLRNGLLTEEQARTHPYRNIITRALGTDAEIEADILRLDKQAGDRYLLCSDGLYEYAPQEEIGRILAHPFMEEAADRFLSLALERGGKDNISLVIAEVTA